MASGLPSPQPQVARALRLLPHEPGVYLFRDHLGRIIYIGRSRDLASRVRSYWSDLGDRPHLLRMVARVHWVEPVLCASEHEAAFLECDLLERHPTHYNRSLGMASCVWLRLDSSPDYPRLSVVHELTPGDGAIWFGPYLGWEPTRQAMGALLRLYPLPYSGSRLTRSEQEMASVHGVVAEDRCRFVREIGLVLERDHSAVRRAVRSLEELRDAAASRLVFEHAALIQEQLRGLLWIVEAQKLLPLQPIDQDVVAVAVADGYRARLTLELRQGSIRQRRLKPFPGERPGKALGQLGPVSSEWLDVAQVNAELMARLGGADALGPLAWRERKLTPAHGAERALLAQETT